jgi:hypothetical protein
MQYLLPNMKDPIHNNNNNNNNKKKKGRGLFDDHRNHPKWVFSYSSRVDRFPYNRAKK